MFQWKDYANPYNWKPPNLSVASKKPIWHYRPISGGGGDSDSDDDIA